MFKKRDKTLEKELFNVLAQATHDHKETLRQFSGIKKKSITPNISLQTYKDKIAQHNTEYFLWDIEEAYHFIARPDVEVISFHPSCLGNGFGPVSAYTKKGSVKADILIYDAVLVK